MEKVEITKSNLAAAINREQIKAEKYGNTSKKREVIYKKAFHEYMEGLLLGKKLRIHAFDVWMFFCRIRT